MKKPHDLTKLRVARDFEKRVCKPGDASDLLTVIVERLLKMDDDDLTQIEQQTDGALEVERAAV